MEKESILYKEMARYRRKFLVINILLTILFVIYTINRLPYLKTEWGGPSPLDTDRFLNETGTIVVDEIIELTRKDSKTPDVYCFKENTYWQDETYSFTLKADTIKKTDVVFTKEIASPGTADKVERDVYRLNIASVGGRNIAVLSNVGQEVKKDMTAYLVKMQKSLISKISFMLEDDEAIEISEYVIDVRGLEMETASTDSIFFWIFIAGLLLLYIKLMRYYRNPLNTPTYKQLQKYGKIETVAEEIWRQEKLPSAVKNGRETVLEEYILTRSDMKLKVVKNHMAKH